MKEFIGSDQIVVGARAGQSALWATSHGRSRRGSQEHALRGGAAHSGHRGVSPRGVQALFRFVSLTTAAFCYALCLLFMCEPRPGA